MKEKEKRCLQSVPTLKREQSTRRKSECDGLDVVGNYSVASGQYSKKKSYAAA